MNVLIVNDLQKDYVYGVLATPDAYNVLGNILQEIYMFLSVQQNGNYCLVFTQDTHFNKGKPEHKYLEELDYFQTEEGKKFPIMHCEQGTSGWELLDEVAPYTMQAKESMNIHIFEKTTFSSDKLVSYFAAKRKEETFNFELIGFNSDTAILATAVNLKTWFPESRISVKYSCCSGITPEAHYNAIIAMQNLNVDIV